LKTTRAEHAGRLTRRAAPYALRFLVLLLVTIQLSPAGPHLRTEPPEPLRTLHPKVCVHTRLTDEVEDWKVQRTLDMVARMGASTIVELFPWAYIEGARGAFDWGGTDRIVNMAKAHGLRIIARLGIVPAWAREEQSRKGWQTTLNSLIPTYYPDFARFVGAFAKRYRGVVDQLVAWNEPNLSFEWGYREVSPEEYVGFLKGVYEAAHAANPAVVVLGGALAPTLEAGGINATNDLTFLRGIYRAGGGAYFDALAVHTYGLTAPEDEAPAPEKLNFRRAELIRQIMLENGDAAKPVYITESGWNDDPRWNQAVGPGARVAYTLAAYQRAERDWQWVNALCMWYFRVPAPSRSYPDAWAFVAPDFTPRAVYEAVRAYATGE